jgi:hypothetical protein
MFQYARFACAEKSMVCRLPMYAGSGHGKVF